MMNHRLRAGRREFDDRKTTMAEREASLRIGEDGALVGATMAQCVGHCLGHGGNRRGRALPPSIPNASDATHQPIPCSGAVDCASMYR